VPFQSTRPRGARQYRYALALEHAKFQSTRPRGARLQAMLTTDLSDLSFNPRARVGRDGWMRTTQYSRHCFNPRARVGRDSFRFRRGRGGRWFQSTRPRGARHGVHNCRPLDRVVSIHAPAWGATGMPEEDQWKPLFQSTRPRGARLEKVNQASSDVKFQSTRPRGARRVRHRLGCGGP